MSKSSTATGTANALLEQSILVESTDLVLRQRNLATFAHFICAGIALWVSWGSAAWTQHVGLTGLLVAYGVVSLWTTARYNAGPATESRARRWSRWLHVSMVLAALIYDALFINMARDGVPHAIEYLAVISLGLSAGCTARYQYLPWLAPTFMTAAFLPQVAYQLLAADGNGAIAVMLLVFLLMMSQTSFTLHGHAMERLKLSRELHLARLEAEELARRDPLTGLCNRLACFELGEQLLALARRHGRDLSAIMLDIDHFKTVNDGRGHAAGDATLIAVAEALRATQRQSDVVSRIGGEEFAILLPDTDAAGAALLAERLREAVSDCRPRGAAEGIRVTISCGVSQLQPEDASLSDLIARADRALYQAKAAGRDQVSLSAAPD